MTNTTLFKTVALTASVLLLGACGKTDNSAPKAAQEPASSAIAAVDGARILAADKEPGNWMTHGRTYDEQRYSPLKQINDGNAKQLGLDWYFDFPTNRGIEATPIVVDGVMYVTGSWSMVFALDARSGETLWQYDPQVPTNWAVNLCCDVVNRGVAVWKGNVFVGTLDGRLIALDAEDGSVLWEVKTTPKDKPYSITGAPRVVKGKVVIGNGGSELGVRGYVSAYDAESGEMAWRFYTVPGNPEEEFENPILEKAASTWGGGEWWKAGGGGTVWDSMAYDAELDLLYIGVGNGAPWNRQIRSPDGGDNLFLSSIVALRPDTGEYVWHYQTTPGETWDYTATQHMILADLKIGDQQRKVIMQAPKNGFFYVLDRATGEFISAEKYTKATWASHVDPETGRPVENPEARYTDGKPHLVAPHPAGGHNWHPMSFSPDTGLVYIPAQENLMAYMHDSQYEYDPKSWNVGVNLAAAGLPENDPAVREAFMPTIRGHISAWDPVSQKEVWRVQHPNMWNGGMLSTAGNLLFQGNADGELVAYRADNGESLWSTNAHTGIVAAPISYAVDGEQYIAVAAGWGGVGALSLGEIISDAKGTANNSRVLVYKLGSDKTLPASAVAERALPEPPPLDADEATLTQGHALYMANCHMCHGDRAVSASSVPDLRYMSKEKHAMWDGIVLGGALQAKGMVGFWERLTKEESDAIHAYIIKRAHDVVEAASTGAP
ncbi:PQQ-dependent dehydrogenase, methanol/ethanol family [Spongiibacter nanhainus]|uniref:PQQ-dependent dehydrogenase, methanol/ethanol family n=1 Tax=Spongiibacter nanhainus TaxID=2794344 RepID=A0A7T4R2H3_9GAMM|nr:PQQ-dependent dehydrogenase, methanol/ethanol family [Spongiibacter nanhainus]QQD19170.1 PQQ-dependent dehydrogenase, methanol/ethanol family [Spongiibacter nanhainus]